MGGRPDTLQFSVLLDLPINRSPETGNRLKGCIEMVLKQGQAQKLFLTPKVSQESAWQNGDAGPGHSGLRAGRCRCGFRLGWGPLPRILRDVAASGFCRVKRGLFKVSEAGKTMNVARGLASG